MCSNLFSENIIKKLNSKEYTMLIGYKNQSFQIIIHPKFIYGFIEMPIKIPGGFFNTLTS